MSNTLPLDVLTSYVPRFIIHRLGQSLAPITEPTAEQLVGAVLFADISGFTALTESLAEQGPAGAEVLSHTLNDYFGQLVDTIIAYGGDVVKFAGDALLAIFPCASMDQALLTEATLRATQCALIIQRQLHNYQTTEGHQLALRIGLGAGNLIVAHVGGLYQRWEFMMAGEPLRQVNLAEKHAQTGQVVLSATAWQLIKQHGVGSSVDDECVEVSQVTAPVTLPTPAMIELSSAAAEVLQDYLPGAIRPRLAAGQSDWLAELRQVTILFVNLPSISYDTSLAQGQELMRTLQTIIYQYEGSVNKLNVDDKGVTLIAVYGLPPLAHEDDVIRGVQAALDIRDALLALNLQCSIGVTSGRVFCGSIGSIQRREYTIMGDPVNLAARLMQAAMKSLPASLLPSGDILCNQTTYEATAQRFEFETLPAIRVKGKAHPIAIYRPLHESQHSLQATSGNEAPIIGRTQERLILGDQMQKLVQGRGGLILIEGEAGIGKSRLVAQLIQKTEAMGIVALIGAGDAIKKMTPYHAWRDIFQTVFGLNDAIYTEDALVTLKKQLPSTLHEQIPLLNVVLPITIPDNDLTSQMKGDARATSTQNLLVKILQVKYEKKPLLVILEDGHWLDSASWALARQVRLQLPKALLTLVTRPMLSNQAGTSVPAIYQQWQQAPDTVHITLDTLSPEESTQLICQRLGVSSLPEVVTTLIQQQAGGHPFFSEEMAYALRDAGIIQISHGECHLTKTNLDTINFPATIQGVITSRIDQLTPQQQFTLKVASVIGHVFPFQMLQDIHPIVKDKPHLDTYLHTLENLDITPLETPRPHLSYIFKHIITQEVAYEMLLFAQRRQLHQGVAEWLERAYTQDLTPDYPLLAYHWERAEVPDKAVYYLDKASEQALQDGAYQEAVTHLQQCLALSNTSSPAKIGRWHRLLGEAYLGIGDLQQCRHHFDQVLIHTDLPLPANAKAWQRGLYRQLRRHLWRVLMGKSPIRQRISHAPIPDEKLEAAYTYSRLMYVYTFANETIPGLYAALNITDLIEQANTAAPLGMAYAYLHGLYRMSHWHGRAQKYADQAMRIAKQSQDPITIANVLFIVQGMNIGSVPWSEKKEELEQGLTLFEKVNNLRGVGDTLGLLGVIYYYRGQYQPCIDIAQKNYQVAQNANNPEHQAWSLITIGSCCLRLGDISQARQLVEEAVPLFATVATSHMAESVCFSLRAILSWQEGKPAEAEEMANRAHDMLKQNLPLTFIMLRTYDGIAQTYLNLWEMKAQAGEAVGGTPQLARQACMNMHKFAWLHPLGLPSTWYYQGQYQWLKGRPRLAYRFWQWSIQKAQQLDMPYEQARTHQTIAEHLPLDDPQRAYHHEQAQNIFQRIGSKQAL